MARQLAAALAGLTTGIYVLTVRAGERQHGMSSSWATQVSGVPVLIMAAVDQQHVTHQMVLQSGAFALNIVGTQSKHLEDYFYSPQSRQPDNLAPFALEIGRTGTPLLQDALASLDCHLVSTRSPWPCKAPTVAARTPPRRTLRPSAVPRPRTEARCRCSVL